MEKLRQIHQDFRLKSFYYVDEINWMYISLFKTFDSPGGAIFVTRGRIRTNLVEVYYM